MENEYGQLELDAFMNSQPVQVSKQMCDVVVLLRVTCQARPSVQDGLKAIHQASRNDRQCRTAIVQPQHGQRNEQRQQYRLAN